jgi:acyl carrier protein
MQGQAAIDAIAAIWAETLGADSVGLDDNFFALGGDSILVTIMALQVEQALGVMVGADLVFDHPTLRDFGQAVLAQGAA